MVRQARLNDDADAPFSLDAWDAPGPRVQRLAHILFEEIDRLFRLEVSDPRLSDVEPTSVQLSPDLRNAKVYYALRRAPDAKLAANLSRARKTQAEAAVREVQAALLRVTPFLRARLADVVVMRRLPDLHFHRDRLAESSLRASVILHKAPPSTSPPGGTSEASETSLRKNP
jgi:ribosome-binding factor A